MVFTSATGAKLRLNFKSTNSSAISIVWAVRKSFPLSKAYLAEKGYDRIYCARPLRRTILTKVEVPLAEKLLEGDFSEGDHIVVDFQDDELSFHKKEAATTAAKE